MKKKCKHEKVALEDILKNFEMSFDNLDFTNIDDLKNAYEKAEQLENTINNLYKENPNIKSYVGLFGSLLNIDIDSTLEYWKNTLSEAIKQNENKKSDKCKCNDSKCDCETCHCSDLEEVEYDTLTPEYVKECLKLCIDNYDNTEKENNTYFNLIADYINNECPYLNIIDSDECEAERDDLIWNLYDFINFTMRR